MKKHILFTILIICLIPIFYNYNKLPIIFKETGFIYFTKITPYLFVMMIMSELFIFLHLEKEKPLLIVKIISSLFHTSTIGSLIYLFSLTSGIPANIYFMKNNYNNKLITKKEIKHILTFSCYYNPLFLYSILKNSFNNTYILILFITPYIYGLILGIIKRPKERFPNLETNIIEEISFPKRIQNIMNTLLYVFGIILLFRILFIYLPNIHFLHGILESSQGLLTINNYHNIYIKYLITSIYISFFGCSILLQIFGIFNTIKKSFKRLILSRINLFIIFLIILFIIYIK